METEGKRAFGRVGFYLALVLLIAVSGACGNALAWSGYCSGTGTGSNRTTLKVCLASNLALYPIVLNLLLLAMLLIVDKVVNLSRTARIVMFFGFAVFVMLNSVLIWNIPFFLQPMR
ncbi:MAG: hypothetical protein KDI03_03345 [Anaerolineae bacterium]|nr:hypothetical protein [Anaerolineae bacterium]